MKAQKLGPAGWLVLLIALVGFLAFLGMYQQQKAALQQLAYRPVSYEGEISGKWVNAIKDLGVATAGDITNDTKLTLHFKHGDVAYARNERPAYFVIEIKGGYIKDLEIEGDKVSDALDLTVDEKSLGVVYTDPEEVLSTVQGMVEKDVRKNGDFRIKIPIDTSVVDVDEIYVGTKFVLLTEPASNVSATKVYDITVKAREADPDHDEFKLEVYADYTTT